MIAKYLWVLGSVILLLLGGLHVRGTLFTEDLYPRDRTLVDLMSVSLLEIDDKAVFWKAWLGFNASFSIGLLFMGFVNLYLVLKHVEVIKNEPLIFIGNALSLCCYIGIAQWFLTDSVIIAFSLPLLCYLVSYGLLVVKK